MRNISAAGVDELKMLKFVLLGKNANVDNQSTTLSYVPNHDESCRCR